MGHIPVVACQMVRSCVLLTPVETEGLFFAAEGERVGGRRAVCGGEELED